MLLKGKEEVYTDLEHKILELNLKYKLIKNLIKIVQLFKFLLINSSRKIQLLFERELTTSFIYLLNLLKIY
jgi:hypothetical protein